MTAEETIAKLQAAQGDPRKLALVTVEIVLSQHKPELRQALEAAAIPHWFNKEILAKLLEIADEKAADYMEQLKRLPMVEPFPARDGWNVHESTRLALRSDLASSQSGKFRKLSALAVKCFPGDQPHEEIERLFHLLVAAPPEAESTLSTLSQEWTDREELLALGPMLLELSSDLLLSNSIDFQLELARLYLKLGEVARWFGQSQQAHVYFTRSEALSEHLAQTEPDRASFQRSLYASHIWLGDLARALGQNESAQAYFQKGHTIVERLAQAEPNRSDFQRELSVSHNKLGDLARDLDQNESAQTNYHKSLAIRERLTQTEPNRTDLQRDLAVSYNKLGDLAHALGQNEEAQAYFQKSLAIRERLAQAEPNRADFQRDLSVSYNKLGDLARALGQNESAQAYFEKDLAIAQRLAQAEPNRADRQRDLAYSYWTVNDSPSALAILEALKKVGRLLPTDEPWLAELRELVQKSKGSSA
jgi:tetratricopeptide (TPR) repeat protein